MNRRWARPLIIRPTLSKTPLPDSSLTTASGDAAALAAAPPSFGALGLAPELVLAAQRAGVVVPTAVQAAAIPPLLSGADARICARTGSGKTAAYALPLLQLLQPTTPHAAAARPGIRALVLLPTRELAQQVAGVLRDLARALPWPTRIVSAVGGVSINPQMLALRGGADVLVATPGRLLDLVQQHAVQLGATRWLVLDEADRLLDLGFADEVQRVLALLPARRQNLLLSATFPADVLALAQGVLRADARQIDIAADADAAPPIVQRAIRVDAPRRTALLRHLLLQQRWPRALVFVATRYAAEHLADKLRQASIPAAAFHGELSQGARADVLAAFQSRDWAIMVTTDLAARGLDVAQLPVVFNYDLPRSPTEYTHRIGRTGRAGQPGLAISLISADRAAHFRLIEKRQGQAVALEDVPGFEPGAWADSKPGAGPAAADGGGIKGRRPNKKDRLRAQAQASVEAAGDAGASVAPAAPAASAPAALPRRSAGRARIST